MFAIVPREALIRYRELPPNARLLYDFLCMYRNRETGKCYPSVESLIEESGLSRTALYQARQVLQAAGWVDFKGNDATLKVGFDEDSEEGEESRNPGIQDSWIPGQQNPGFRDSRIPGFQDSKIPDSGTTKSGIPGFAYKEEQTIEQRSLTERERARAADRGDLSGPGDSFDQQSPPPSPVTTSAPPDAEALAPELTQTQRAVALAVGWIPDRLGPKQWPRIRKAAETLDYHDDATPERIARAPAFYHAQGKYSFSPEYIANDWRQIADWIELTSYEVNSNGITQQASAPPRRETHNARAARRSLELINELVNEEGGHDRVDPENSDSAGLALDRP